MKSKMLVGALVLILGIGSLFVYAAETPATAFVPGFRNPISPEEREAWFKERTEFKKEQLKKALEDNLITKEEAKIWEDHFTYIEKFHDKNGFMPGNCQGLGSGMGRMRGHHFTNKGRRWVE